VTAAAIDCLFVGLFREYGRADRDYSYEYLNIWTGLLEHPRLKTRGFFPDLEAARHGHDGMRARFAQHVLQNPPDVLIHVLFDHDLDVGLEVIGELSQRGVMTAEFDADSSWRFDAHIQPRLPYYRSFITTHAPSVPRYHAAGADALLTQWAVSSWYRNFPPTAQKMPAITFAGKAHGERLQTIYDLRRAGIPLHVMGAGWSTSWRHRQVLKWRNAGQNLGYVSFTQMCANLAAGQASLNLTAASRHDTDEQIKGRHFEIPALGTCQITTPVADLEQFLIPDTEIIVAEPGEPLAQACQQLLRDPRRAQRIAQASWQRVWAEHTWEQRIDDWLAHWGL